MIVCEDCIVFLHVKILYSLSLKCEISQIEIIVYWFSVLYLLCMKGIKSI